MQLRSENERKDRRRVRRALASARDLIRTRIRVPPQPLRFEQRCEGRAGASGELDDAPPQQAAVIGSTQGRADDRSQVFAARRRMDQPRGETDRRVNSAERAISLSMLRSGLATNRRLSAAPYTVSKERRFVETVRLYSSIDPTRRRLAHVPL